MATKLVQIEDDVEIKRRLETERIRLRKIAGLDRPTSGEIELLGHRTQPLLGELAHRPAQLLVLVRQVEVESHQQSDSASSISSFSPFGVRADRPVTMIGFSAATSIFAMSLTAEGSPAGGFPPSEQDCAKSKGN